MSTETKTKPLTRRWEKNERQTVFAVIGDKGAIHFWFSECSQTSKDVFGQSKYGGVEMHSRVPLSYSKEEPDHENCWLLNAPCWHDGSSLYAEETYIPKYEYCESMNDFEPMWRALECEYERRFATEETI